MFNFGLCWFGMKERCFEDSEGSVRHDGSKEVLFKVRGGFEIAGKEWGKDRISNRILCLHGWLDNSASFSILGPILAEAGYYVISIDLLGHGVSSHFGAGSTYHILEYLPSLQDLIIIHLKWAASAGSNDVIPPFRLIGHSMSASICVLLAGTLFRDTISSIVCIDGFGGFIHSTKDILHNLSNLIQYNNSIQSKINSGSKYYPSLQAAVRARGESNFSLPLGVAALLVRRSTKKTPHGVCFTFDQKLRLRSLLQMPEATWHAIFSNIKCRVFLIIAKSGVLTQSESFFKVIQDRIHCVKNIEVWKTENEEHGHHIHLVNPEDVTPPILEFFNSKASSNL
eukprot:TRINITY_DN19997_c0_g1_i1.p1 TRINITY_DN19997_c0_g1~~TRINITY_DN19997_c0_g1_i1.p1  ORF type:complete len:340 (-),score=36.80 TRINITY_DN19997_c0_g1_i1:43-1062(-)